MTTDERRDIAARALPLVDLTDLNEGCNRDDIADLCRRAQTKHGPVGAICIWPRFVSHAHSLLAGTDIPIATVVNFPGGNQAVDMTVVETRSAIDDGAAEIDLVMPYRAFASGEETLVREMIASVRRACGHDALLKVILETGELKDDDLIRAASKLALEEGADFIKTSTGKVPVNATLEAAEIMIDCIAETDRNKGFKPAGGIKTVEDCGAYLAMADEKLGADWASPATFRFGASSVLDNLLAALDGKSDAGASDGY